MIVEVPLFLSPSFLEVIEIESAQVEAKRKFVKLDEEIASGKADEAQALKNECESDLAEAIPALEAALSALDTLKASVGTGCLWTEHPQGETPWVLGG